MPRKCKAELIFAVKHCPTKNKLAARRAIARRERKKFNKIAQNRGFCAKAAAQSHGKVKPRFSRLDKSHDLHKSNLLA